MSASGQKATSAYPRGTSASPPIVLQKSKVAGRRILHENRKREAIADSYSFTAISEVACEFNERRRGPSHLYLKAAPPARRIFEPQCKTSFATQSPRHRTSTTRSARSAKGLLQKSKIEQP